jgi:hypothetical protein
VKKNYYFAVCKRKHMVNLLLCRVPKKAHCAKIKHMANIAFAVYFSFAVCFCKHTRENAYLPCARERAHGKL